MAVTKFRASQIADATAEDGLKSAQFNNAEITTAKLADGAKLIMNDGSKAFGANQGFGGFKATGLADGTVATDAATKGQMDTALALKAALAGSTGQVFSVADAVTATQATSLQQVQALLSSAGAASEWQNSCDTYQITVPGSPITGQRVFIIQSYVADTGVITLGTPAGAFTGKAGQIAQWSGSAWVFTVVTNGTYVSVDTETTGFFFYSGTWAFKEFEATTAGAGLTKTANAIALAATTGGAGLTFSSGVLAVGAGTGITVNADDIALSATVAGAGLTHTTGVLAVGGGNGITVSADAIAINADGSTLDGSAAALKVKAAGITGTELAASVAGSGLTGGAGSALAVGSGNGITVSADAIAVNADGSTLDGSAAALKVKAAGITGTELAASVAGNGLTGGAGSALAVGAGMGITVAADAVSADLTVLHSFTNHRYNITPTGTPNNVLVTFTLPATPVANTLQLFVSGILQEPGAGNDFTISGATLTMAVAPASTDKLRAFYFV